MVEDGNKQLVPIFISVDEFLLPFFAGEAVVTARDYFSL